MMVRTFTSYDAARNYVAKQFPGKRIRVSSGVIELWAEFDGRMIPVTGVRADMPDRVRAFKKAGRRYEFRIRAGTLIWDGQ